MAILTIHNTFQDEVSIIQLIRVFMEINFVDPVVALKIRISSTLLVHYS